MKIKSKNPNVKKMRLAIPFDGIVTINNEGIADVSEKAAAALVRGTREWEYYGKQPAEKKETSETDGAEEQNEAPASEAEEVIEGIKSMSLDEMTAMAKEAGYDTEEWQKFSKKPKLMAAYLIKKYNEARNESE